MENFIQNSNLLIDAVGKFPTFHDAEVLEITLKRKDGAKSSPTLQTIIRIVRLIEQIKDEKVSLLHLKYDVDLTFTDICGLKLENFNHQNVLSDLYVSDFSDEYWNSIKDDPGMRDVVSQSESDRLNYYVKFEYCYGIEAEFLCGSITANSVTQIAV